MILRFTIYMLLLLISVSGIAQEKYPIKVNYKDKKVQAYYSPKKVKTQNDVFYYWMIRREIHFSKGGYSGKVLVSDYEEFYLSNQLKEKGQFVKGTKNGEWKNWYESGTIKSIYNWNKGKRSGKYFLYNDQGKLIEKGAYSNNKLHGKQYSFEKDTILVRKYRHGVLKPEKVKEPKERKSFWSWFKRKDKEKKEKREKKFSLKKLFKKKESKIKENIEEGERKKKARKNKKEQADPKEKVSFWKKIKSWFKRSDRAEKKG